MQITQTNIINLTKTQKHFNIHKETQNKPRIETTGFAPVGFKYYQNINFLGHEPGRGIQDMEFENYKHASESTKKRYRKLYETFSTNNNIDKSQLFDPSETILPLISEETMDEFIKTSRIFLKFKDQPIFCLGRSPKWFLNTALWMKDGIQDYKFIAFSKAWYRPDSGGAVRMDSKAPTEEEVAAYRKYLKRIQADPQSIVENMEKTGKKTVITDYICSGKGACSFLEILADYANDLGILDKFANSIHLVGIGSIDYMEDLDPYSDTIPAPKFPLPNLLKPYKYTIYQEFHNMDYTMFREMLLNQNTNECRSSYYPPEAWTVYKPDRFKTGMVTDMKKVKAMLKGLKEQKYIKTFSPAMQDFRNLLNFRILDALNSRKLLKEIHRTKL